MIKSKDDILLSQAKRIDEMTKQIENYKVKKNHNECVEQIYQMIEHLKIIRNEDKSIKSELFKCKYTKSHCEESQEFRKVGNYDKKCIAVEMEHLHLKSETDKLKIANKEKTEAIKKLEMDI